MYAQDFDMDTKSWTAIEVGVYIRLLNYEWVNGSLPNTMAQLARIAQIDPRNMQKMWSAVIAKKFTTDAANMYVNKRMEEEREKQLNYRISQQEKGVKRAAKMWEGHIATATKRLQPKDSLSSSISSSINNKRFIKPTLEEIKAYCQLQNYSVNPEKWLNHYESNGWMVGKNKMKDWKASIRTWESNNNNGSSSLPKQGLQTEDEQLKRLQY
jgi:uncharacterized protein YdaU (DUF1376 family)